MLGAATLGSALIGANSAKKAGRAQERAGNRQMRVDETNRARTDGYFEPYRESGGNFLNQLNAQMGMNGEAPDFDAFRNTPGYQFAVDEGQRAIQGSAAASGNDMSGTTMKALQDRRMGVADQSYGNYMNRLFQGANMGQAAAGGMAANGANSTANQMNAIGSIGNAQSAGIIGQNNAIQGGINNMMSGYMMNQTTRGGSMPSINLQRGSGAEQAVFGSGRWF